MTDPQRIFLFDIDGTLLLTGGAGKMAFEAIFEELYQQPSIWNNLNPDGRTDLSIIEEIFESRFGVKPSKQDILNITNLYYEKLPAFLPQSSFKLLPGVLDTLEQLNQSADTVLGLATGNFETSAWQKLKHGKLDHYFSCGGFGSDSIDRQELTHTALQRANALFPNTEKTIYVIGDTIHDIRCGKSIGAQTIAVCTGSTSRKTLEEANPTWVLDTLEDFEINIFQ